MLIAAFIATQMLAAQTNTLEVGTQPGELQDSLRANTACVFCHSSADDPDISVRAYTGTMMNLAGVDPIFLAATEISYQSDPVLSEVCVRCHFPKGWLDGNSGVAANNYGMEGDDLEGISCDFCHRMVAPDPTDPSSVVPPPELSGVVIANSQVSLTAFANVKQGPHGSALLNGHSSTQSSLMTDSVMCAQCHDVSNDFLTLKDANLGDTGEVMPLERTYTEWRDSAYSDPTDPDANSCQGCHFERYAGYAATAGPPPYRPELARHTIVGGNHIVPKMVAEIYRGDLNAPGWLRDLDADADRVVDATIRNLQDYSAEMTARELVVDEDGARLVVRVENKAGHKLPTGYSEGRRMWIGHNVVDSVNGPGPRTGTPKNDTWDIAEEPVRTWEVQLSEDFTTHSFELPTVDKVLKDNRIPPKGFRARISTLPIGQVFETQPDGTLAHWDDVELPLGDSGCWPVVVDVTLYFQTISGDYYRFLVDNAPINGPALAAAWEATGGAIPVEMENLSVTVFPDGTIVDGRLPGACEPAPVYEEPGPDVVTPEPTPTPTPNPAVVEPEPSPPVLDNCAGVGVASASRPLASFGLVLLFGLAGLAGVARRRRSNRVR